MAKNTKTEMVMLSVKLPKPLAERLKAAAKSQGKLIQFYAAEVIAAGLGAAP